MQRKRGIMAYSSGMEGGDVISGKVLFDVNQHDFAERGKGLPDGLKFILRSSFCPLGLAGCLILVQKESIFGTIEKRAKHYCKLVLLMQRKSIYTSPADMHLMRIQVSLI